MAKKKTKLGRFSRHQLDKHRALLAEVPEKAPERQNNVNSMGSDAGSNTGLQFEDRKGPHAESHHQDAQFAPTSRGAGVHGRFG